MDAKYSLKVVMNKQNTKVLFAEAGSDFANVLFSFLTLPLGKIVQLLKKQCGADEEVQAIGSLTSLYSGLSNLDVANFYEEGVKQMLLDPPRPGSPFKYFCCENIDCVHSKKYNISLYRGIARCDCGKLMIREVRSTFTDDSEPDDDGDVGGDFAASGASLVLSDGLMILPNVPGSVIQILGIIDSDFGDMQNLSLDFKEIMDLLKGLFLSRTPLTDIIVNNGKINFATTSDQPEILLPKVEKKRSSSTSYKMTLKVTVQISTNKLLFAQSDEEFIELLFGLLAIPLGGVVRLLKGSTCAGNIDNLYKSVVERIDEKYFESKHARDSLVVSEVPHGYMINHSLLFLETKLRKVYYYRGYGTDDDSVSLSHTIGGSCVKVTSFKFPEGYVKGPRLYVINDDLSVEPSGTMTYLSKLRMLEIPMSDVSELELQIGLEEVLSILKAALVSKHALSHGLSSLLMKQPKQEQ